MVTQLCFAERVCPSTRQRVRLGRPSRGDSTEPAPSRRPHTSAMYVFCTWARSNYPPFATATLNLMQHGLPCPGKCPIHSYGDTLHASRHSTNISLQRSGPAWDVQQV